MNRHRRIFSFIAALLLGASCFAAGEIPTANSFTNAFEREVFLFAQNFSERAVRGTVTTEEVLDLGALADRSLKGVRSSPKLREEMERGLQNGLGPMFVAQFRQVKNLRLLNVRREGTDVRAVFRVIGGEGSLNYVELLCEPRAGRRICAVDVFNWTTGEYVSETMRHMVGVMEQQKPTALDRITGKEDPNVEMANAINEMNRLAKAGQWEAVLKRYAQLPPKLQREKVFAVHRARAAAKVDQNEYLEALKFWQVNFPRDPSIDLISLDALTHKGKYDVALEMVERLDRNIGGDPFLEVMRAVLRQKLGQPDVAKARVKEALRREPELGRLLSPGLLRLAREDYRSTTSMSSSSPATGKPSSKMRLQGIFLRNDRSSAVIGGETVYEGDTFEGMQVVKIEKSRVTLQSATGALQSLTFD